MITRHTISFRHAFEGVVWAFRTQPNYIVHSVLGLSALVGGMVLGIEAYEMLVILVLITLGLAIETVNTAIELTCDAIDIKRRPDIKIAKDVAAGAMLITAIGSLLIALYIFIPRLVMLMG